MLRRNENENCWDGRIPFKLDFSNWEDGFAYETSISVRSRNDITNDDVNESFVEVMEHLGHLSQKIVIHPEIIAQFIIMRRGGQLVFKHQSLSDTFILTGLHYFHVLPGLHKLANGIEDEMKSVSEFKGAVLRGFKYKHLKESSIPSFAKNIESQIKKPGWFEQQIQKYKAQLDAAQSPKEQAGILSHIAVVEALQDRTADRHMTGEWIVFSEHSDGLELLTIAAHLENDQDIKDRIASTEARIILSHKHPIDECPYRPLFV